MITQFFESGGFIPHGHCYLWQTNLVGLHILSDGVIALAYYSIPIMLLYFVRQRQDTPFQKVFFMFGAFIIACGTTHIMEIWTLWFPTYWLSGGIKAITALISIYTASELVFLIPSALALPSAAQLIVANQALEKEINERKRAENDRKQVEASLARIAAIVEYSGEAIISKSLDGIILSWNNAAAKIFGYEAEEIIGQSIAILIPPNLTHEEQQILETIRQGEKIKNYETVRVRKDGQLIHISSTISPLKDTTGRIVGASVIKRDISDRKRAENDRQQIEIALRNSEEQFRHAFEDASIGMAILSLDGHWLKVNPALCQIVGYSSEELLTLTFEDITYPEDLEEDLNNRGKLLAGTMSTYQREKRYIHKQGYIVWILLNGSVVQDEQGNPLHIIAHIQDITARKETQKTLELQSIIMNNMAGRRYRRGNCANRN